jgi:hypothetical protein
MTTKSMKEPETLKRHKEMFERRMQQIKQRRGLSERQILDIVNRKRVSPKSYKR